jgi:hypothetical protein
MRTSSGVSMIYVGSSFASTVSKNVCLVLDKNLISSNSKVKGSPVRYALSAATARVVIKLI